MSTTEQKARALELADIADPETHGGATISRSECHEISNLLYRFAVITEERDNLRAQADADNLRHLNHTRMIKGYQDELAELRAQVEALTSVLAAVDGEFDIYGNNLPDGFNPKVFVWVKDALAAHPTPSPLTRPAVDDQEIDRVINRLESDDPDFEDCSAAASLLTKLKSLTRPAVPDAKAMANRLMGWKLPKNFSPDCFISFDRAGAEACKTWPIGTNLFTVDQATEMFEYVLAAAPQPHATDGSPCWCNPEIIKEDGGDVIVHNSADNWQQYAKPGETAQACIERHRGEHDSLMSLLAQARAATAPQPEAQPTEAAQPQCWCLTCRPMKPFIDPSSVRMALCPECGNKRCPKANDHRHDCTGSNEPGQPGSAYPAAQKGGV